MKVAVIGAGPAGLVSAREVLRHGGELTHTRVDYGQHYVLLEARTESGESSLVWGLVQICARAQNHKATIL